MSLKIRMILRWLLGVVFVSAVLFIPAGSANFWQGWVLMGVVFISGASGMFYFYRNDPQLIERRLKTKEKIGEQKLLIRLMMVALIAIYPLPGLDYRFGWSRRYLRAVPLWLEVLCQALVLGSFLFVIWVMKVNSFAARTIQVEAGQKVISTGPYRIVRHPMYLGAVVMALAIPLALVSFVAWPAFALLILFYVFRLLDEEKFLRQDLPGYSEYCAQTRYHLIPFVW